MPSTILPEQSPNSLLYEAGQRLSGTLDLNEIYQVICEFMASVAPNNGFVISRFDPASCLIKCRAYYLDNTWLNVAPFPPIPLEDEGKGTQSVVIRTGESLLIDDYQARVSSAKTKYTVNGETNEVSDEVPPEEQVTRSAMIVPLKLDGQVTGVIQVMSYRFNAFSRQQLQLLEALALHIASAERNALLYAQVQAELNERKIAEAQLETRKTELQRLYASLQTVREEERYRFARELHDDVGQRITTLRMDLAWLDTHHPSDSPRISERQASIGAQLDQLADSIRRITEDLRPGMLDTLGLGVAIRNYADKFAERTGIACELVVSDEELKVEDKLAIGLFRIVQEALNNVFKHAAASCIRIELKQANGQVALMVEDNGIGLVNTHGGIDSGFGLLGMRERVSILNGRINISSPPGKGVRIEVRIPEGAWTTA